MQLTSLLPAAALAWSATSNAFLLPPDVKGDALEAFKAIPDTNNHWTAHIDCAGCPVAQDKEDETSPRGFVHAAELNSALVLDFSTNENNEITVGGSRERTLSDARSFASLNIKRDEASRAAAAPATLDSPIIPPDHFRSRDLIPPRPHTSGGPRTTTGPPPGAAGAHRGGLTGLDPPPRGFLGRPRVGSASGPSTRA